jgi:hypothetical protein
MKIDGPFQTWVPQLAAQAAWQLTPPGTVEVSFQGSHLCCGQLVVEITAHGVAVGCSEQILAGGLDGAALCRRRHHDVPEVTCLTTVATEVDIKMLGQDLHGKL